MRVRGVSGVTLNVIKVYRDGNASVKDRETDGFAFVKRNCLHCVDPSCVSVCPVGAMIKDPVTGIVWLAERMGQYGQRIEAGQVILSGSFIRPVECPKGSVIDADFGPFGRVGCTFA